MNPLFPRLCKSFVIWAVACVAIGWGLSAIHELKPLGYVVACPLAVLGLAWLLRDARREPSAVSRVSRSKLFSRFRRPLPLVFLVVAGLELLGGILYAPNNYDGLTYRLPRMLNWLGDGTWHWIPTYNPRLNYSGSVCEWMAMPLLVLTRSDRALFLTNYLGFLLMPGLLFAVFRQLGVARCVAWTWMWLLPLAYGYALQAGGIGNDLPGAVFCLVSIYFGLRARRSGSLTEIWLALLAAALMTGLKLSNLPLALPCVVAVWPALLQLRKNVAGTLAVAALAVVVSALPTMALNLRCSGSWTGDAQDFDQLQVKSPVAALLGNSLLLAEQSLLPPLLPGARKINDAVVQHLPAAWHQLLHEKYPRFFLNHLIEWPGEENAGLGLGVTFLLLAGVVVTIGTVSLRRWRQALPKLFPLPVLGAWIASAFFLVKVGSEAAPRLMLSYYPLAFVPCCLLSGQRRLLQNRFGRFLPVLAALSILPPVILSAARPMWPARFFSSRLAHSHPDNSMLQRLAATYDAYAHRNDVLAPLRDHLPAEAREVGFLAGCNDTDYSLLRPFGQRRVVHLRQAADHFLAHPDEVEWLAVKESEWLQICPTPLAEWARTNHFEVVYSTDIVELVSGGGETWFLLHRAK